MVSFNPACYIPSTLNQYLPSAIACPPTPTLFSSLTSPLTATYTLIRQTMGALVSVPILSFLLIPTMTSYSTSLNLLFFYLTWSTLVLSHPPLRVELVSTLAVRVIFYIIPSMFFLLFDVLLPSAAESFKSNSTVGMPFYRASRRRTLLYVRQILWALGNILLATLLQSVVEVLLTRVFAFRSALKITTRLPMPWSVMTDLLRGFLLREILTYILHRYLLHSTSSSPLIRRLARLHNTWYHTIPAPYPLSATYDHPVAYLVRSFLPTFLPALLFRFHLLTYLLYTALASLEEMFAHSGYATVPTNFILGGIARRTDDHVLYDGNGNFGVWGLTDWVMGTGAGDSDDVIDDVVNEAERRDMPRRLRRSGQQIGDKVRRRIGNGTAGVKRGGRKRVTAGGASGRSGSGSDE